VVALAGEVVVVLDTTELHVAWGRSRTKNEMYLIN
jgi:hypothetical protein